MQNNLRSSVATALPGANCASRHQPAQTILFFERKILPLQPHKTGEMLEWLKRHAWKACIPLKGITSSNLVLSALNNLKTLSDNIQRGFFLFLRSKNLHQKCTKCASKGHYDFLGSFFIWSKFRLIRTAPDKGSAS